MCATRRRAFSRVGSSGVLTVSPFTLVKEYSHAIDEESVKSAIGGRLTRVGYARTIRPCRRIRQGFIKCYACAKVLVSSERVSASRRILVMNDS